jgi:high-affinity iron transporter
MLAAFLITLRESLEAVLIVGIIVAFLVRAGCRSSILTVVWGALAGLILSFVFGLWFASAESLLGISQDAFEGVIRFVAAGLLIYMIVWMAKQNHIAVELEQRVAACRRNSFSLALLVAVAILREGAETVIFLSASGASSQQNLEGGIEGIIGALAIGYLFFLGAKKIPLAPFFKFTNFLLAFFAAGVAMAGTAKFQAVGFLPAGEPVWDSSALLDPTGFAGQFINALFGYTATPTALMLATWLGALALIALLFKYLDRVHRVI